MRRSTCQVGDFDGNRSLAAPPKTNHLEGKPFGGNICQLVGVCRAVKQMTHKKTRTRHLFGVGLELGIPWFQERTTTVYRSSGLFYVLCSSIDMQLSFPWLLPPLHTIHTATASSTPHQTTLRPELPGACLQISRCSCSGTRCYGNPMRFPGYRRVGP